MKETNAIWFGKVGIVLGRDVVTNEYKSYIGIGEGLDEAADTESISKHGHPYPVNAALELFGKAG